MASSFRKFIKGVRVVPESSSTSSESGDLEVDSASGKLKYYNAGQTTQNSAVVTEEHQQTLTNKTISSSSGLDFSGATSGQTKLQATSVASGTLTLPAATDKLVGEATAAVLTNKTIDGDDNTIQDISISSLKTDASKADTVVLRDSLGAVVSQKITNTNIDATAAIARSKIASGTADHVIINSATGALSSEQRLAISRGGTNAGDKTTAFDNLSPLSTAGDIVCYNGTNNAALPIGSNGFVLSVNTSNANKLEWVSSSSLVGNPVVRAVSSSQTLLVGDGIILATAGSGGVTLTLPSASSGKVFNIKKIDSGAGSVQILPPVGATIDDAASKTLTNRYQSLTVVTDGTTYFII